MTLTSGVGALAALTESLSQAADDRAAASAAARWLADHIGGGTAVVSGGVVIAAAGLLEGAAGDLAAAAETRSALVEDRNGAPLHARSFPLPRCDDEFLLAAWRREPPAADAEVAHAVGRALGPWLALLRALATERHRRRRNEGQARDAARTLAALREREALMRKTLVVQQSISHRAPLQDVLDSITEGLTELLGADLAAVRLIDPEDPRYALIASSSGIRADVVDAVGRTPVGLGAGGRAITEGKVVLIRDYEHDPNAIPRFASQGVRTAMAAPVHESGQVVGSLVAASLDPQRSYSEAEQEALLLFAENISLALTDAKTVAALRLAQEEREMFLAMVSHELKTPLAVITGALHALHTHPGIDEEVRSRLLLSARDRAGDIQGLIDRLLQGTRAELAGLGGETGLRALVEAAARDFGSVRPIETSAVPDLVIAADERSLGEVLGILLENAVAHSPEDTPISIECAHSSAGATVAVRNRGVLAADDPASLFLPWQRGGSARSEGVGLGLYIAGRIARAIGCRLTAAAADGIVTFTMIVPADRVRAAGA